MSQLRGLQKTMASDFFVAQWYVMFLCKCKPRRCVLEFFLRQTNDGD